MERQKQKRRESGHEIPTIQSSAELQQNDKRNYEYSKQYRHKLQEKKLHEHELLQTERSDLNISQYDIYEELYVCPMPDAILHHEINIPGDGNCLFHSLIRVKQLQILTSQLRKQLLDSPYLYSCQNPNSAKQILESQFDYGDLDCIFIFSREYNQNVCIHYHFLHKKEISEFVRFCYFKVNNTTNVIHLHLRDNHYTPYIQIQHLTKDVRNSRENEYISSHTNVQMCHPCDDFDAECNAVHTDANLMEVEDDECIDDDDMRLDHELTTIPIYTSYYKHIKGHLDFYTFFKSNTFGHSCAICDRLWWKNDLRKSSEHQDILLTILGVFISTSIVILFFHCSSNFIFLQCFLISFVFFVFSSLNEK